MGGGYLADLRAAAADTLAATEHAERLRVAREAAGWLLDRVSTYLRERGQYRRAKPIAEQALAPPRPRLDQAIRSRLAV